MTKRAAVYLRLSVAQGEDVSHSVKYQQARCEALCKSAGYEIVSTFVDDGSSAYVKGSTRKGWEALREAVQTESFDVLVFDRQDRLARQQKDTLRFIADCDDHQISWHSVKEGITDLSDPMHVMFAVYRGGDAQAYSATISANTAKGNASRRAEGRMFASGATPFGYNNDRMTLKEPEAQLIRTGIRMILDGKSLLSVVKLFRASPVKPRRSGAWQYISVRDMLTPWRNAGVVSYRGQPTDQVGQWEPIVTRAELEQARTILLARKGHRRRATHLLSGVANCHCGEWMSGKNANGKATYSCSATQRGLHLGQRHVSIRVADLDNRVRQAITGYFLVHIRDNVTPNHEKKRLADAYSSRDALSVERRKVQDGFLANILTEAEASQKVAEIEAKTAQAQARIEALENESASLRMKAATMRVLQARYDESPTNLRGLTTEGIAAAFDRLPIEDARQLVAATLTITVYPGTGIDRVEIDFKGKPQT